MADVLAQWFFGQRVGLVPRLGAGPLGCLGPGEGVSRALFVSLVALARQTVDAAIRRQAEAHDRHRDERRVLLGEVYGEKNLAADPVRWEVAHPAQEAEKWQHAVRQARAQAERLRALTPAEATATAHIDAQQAERQAQQQAQERAQAERIRRLCAPFQRDPFGQSRPPGPSDSGPARGL
jgi:hypothetical protein